MGGWRSLNPDRVHRSSARRCGQFAVIPQPEAATAGPTMADAPVLFFAPFVSSVLQIVPNSLGETGSLGPNQYQAFIDQALAELLNVIGFNPKYRATRQSFVVLAENHLTYRRKLGGGDRVRLTAQLIDCDDERIHLYTELRHAIDGWLAVSGECLFVHVDLRSDESVRFPEAIIHNLIVMRAAHARLPRPNHLGQTIDLQPQVARLT